MDALVMCGGRGSRLDGETEKPLSEVGGRPMVDRVREALERSRVETVHAVPSPHAPRTRDYLSKTDLPILEAPGAGYVADLQYALDRVAPPVLTVAADLPLLTAETVDAVLEAFSGRSLTVCVPVALKRRLGASVDTVLAVDGCDLAPSGVNVVAEAPNGGEDTVVFDDARLAVNVNRRRDVRVAEALL